MNCFHAASIGQRSKRRKVEKKSASAFEKLRELKQGGKRDKWGAEESSKIYDEVNEEEYSKIMSERNSDWIVGDGEFIVQEFRIIDSIFRLLHQVPKVISKTVEKFSMTKTTSTKFSQGQTSVKVLTRSEGANCLKSRYRRENH